MFGIVIRDVVIDWRFNWRFFDFKFLGEVVPNLKHLFIIRPSDESQGEAVVVILAIVGEFNGLNLSAEGMPFSPWHGTRWL